MQYNLYGKILTCIILRISNKRSKSNYNEINKN